MSKLPEIQGGMKLDQAMLLELYHIMIDNKIITEEQAIERYKRQRSRVGSIEWQQYDQELNDE